MNLMLGGYELEAWRSSGGLVSYYSKLQMSALSFCAVLKTVILGSGVFCFRELIVNQTFNNMNSKIYLIFYLRTTRSNK